jgi:hypothetical protein
LAINESGRIGWPLLWFALIGAVGSPAPAPDGASRESELLRWLPCVVRCGEPARQLTPEEVRLCARGDMVHLLAQLAGPGAVDCGDVALRQDRAAALDCVAEALAGDSPFFAAFDVQGIDSAVAIGIVRTAEPRLRMLHWDSDVQGGGNPGLALPAIWLEECGRIEVDRGRRSAMPTSPVRCLEPRRDPC